MKIVLYRNNKIDLGDFMQAIQDFADSQGHECVILHKNELGRGKFPKDADIAIAWNGEKGSMRAWVLHTQARKKVVLCVEHGYLRRSGGWQLDPRGINAGSTNCWWKRFPVPNHEDFEFVKNIRRGFEERTGIKYEDPEGYVLVAIQTPTDINITKYAPKYVNLDNFVRDVNYCVEKVGKIKLRIRTHPKVAQKNGIKTPPLADDLNRCKYVITINSNTAHEAMVAKKDVIALGPHVYTSKSRLSPANGGVVFSCDMSLRRLVGAIEECEKRLKAGANLLHHNREMYLRYIWDREWTVEEARSGTGLLDVFLGRPKAIGCRVEMQKKWHDLRAVGAGTPS